MISDNNGKLQHTLQFCIRHQQVPQSKDDVKLERPTIDGTSPTNTTTPNFPPPLYSACQKSNPLGKI